MPLAKPLLVGRGPWAQKIYVALLNDLKVVPTLSGAITAHDCIREAKARGNDCVIIASKSDSHFDLLMEALKHELPVFCEKPMVLNASEAETAYHAWLDHGRPSFLCDFVHLWSRGFEYAWQYVHRPAFGSMTKFHAILSGDVRRKDVHPVWDYACHAIAMAAMFGVDLRELTLNGGYGDQWFLENEHCEIIVDVNKGNTKKTEFGVNDVFDCKNGTWTFPHGPQGGHVIRNADDPPLQRVLKCFLDDGAIPAPVRTGMGLPVRVTGILESLCPSKSPFA